MIFYMIKQPLVGESNVESGLWLDNGLLITILRFWNFGCNEIFWSEI